MMTYSEAQALMKSARDPSAGKPLGNNTRLYEREVFWNRKRITVYAIRLHATDVVTVYPNCWALATNGWTTPTTAQRLWKYAPLNYRTYGAWEFTLHTTDDDPEPDIGHSSPVWRAWRDRHRIPLFNGIKIDSNGYPLKSEIDAYFKAQRKAEREEKRRQREQEARARHARHLARLRSGYMQRREARTPRFERLANHIALNIREAREVLTTNESLEVTQ